MRALYALCSGFRPDGLSPNAVYHPGPGSVPEELFNLDKYQNVVIDRGYLWVLVRPRLPRMRQRVREPSVLTVEAVSEDSRAGSDALTHKFYSEGVLGVVTTFPC